MAAPGLMADGVAEDAGAPAEKQFQQERSEVLASGEAADGPAPPPEVDLSQVTARQNLNETAFFFPHLMTDDEGRVRMQFKMPEALTEWKFMGFAHDRRLRSGYLQDKAVTAKDLMVEPNPPRFLREGDVLEFTVRVSNQSPTRQTGSVRLTFNDARTGDPMDSQLGNTATDQSFDVPAGQSQSYSWRLTVPDEMGFLTYKAVGSTGRLSDGEEGYLPVLSRRILVTESLPLPIRGPDTKQFQLAKLVESGQSDSLQHQSLTIQMVSNPSWYAVMALPYLMEFPHQCTEQTFNRLYANSLARHIAISDPRIRRVFDQWKATPALDSPLEKNQDLKAVMLEETPWLRQAQAESQARRNVGILFDDNRLNDETARLLQRISEQQREDGAWPWFPGGPPNDFITLYITTGFGRLRHLGVDISVAPAVKALEHLDGWVDRQYREIVRLKRQDQNNLSTTIALYLYGRSFFLEDQRIGDQHREAVDYFLNQASKYWLQLAHRQSQGHLAIALKRFGNAETPIDIMRSIKERAVTDEEMGMFWRELEFSWWWYRAPIETQAVMIEAFDEVMNDAQAVEDCKVWLLKQKQTQDWKTTKATADAVYALLLRGTHLLASTELVQVTLGDTVIQPQNVEAGTGFYEQRFVRGEVQPQMGEVTVTKVDEGVAWGSLHWQYLEDMAKITPHEATPLVVRKRLYVKEYTDRGPVLKEVDGPISVGDELVVRIGIRVDRDMEYVHLKDHRGAGTEPVNVLSQYKYQDGLAYYESTRDTASHFFIDYLPKGTYVFEYSTRVVHRGEYQTGMAQIQCMYAPEFNSHSESIPLTVQ
ncbi:MAG: alpha-2-macroglobulin family protein [Planctomycetaceae bacterium]|nr:MAG: alpha-2-macroglobulin family protein [Planctomycetaceae bacterium]